MNSKSSLLGLNKKLDSSTAIINFYNTETITASVASTLINLYGEALLKEKNLTNVRSLKDIANLPKEILADVEEIILGTGRLYEQAMWSLVMGAVIVTDYKNFYCDSIVQFIEEFFINDPEKYMVSTQALLRLERYLRKMNPNEFPCFAFELLHESDDSFVKKLEQGYGHVQAYEIEKNEEGTVLHALRLINSGEYFMELHNKETKEV